MEASPDRKTARLDQLVCVRADAVLSAAHRTEKIVEHNPAARDKPVLCVISHRDIRRHLYFRAEAHGMHQHAVYADSLFCALVNELRTLPRRNPAIRCHAEDLIPV